MNAKDGNGQGTGTQLSKMEGIIDFAKSSTLRVLGYFESCNNLKNISTFIKRIHV